MPRVKVTGTLGDDTALSGSLTHYSNGCTIELYGMPSTHCVGNFRHRQVSRLPGGVGALICDDRCSGPFSFTMRDMKHGSGTGRLGDQTLVFSF